ncbi:MAG: PadR family transcriptional regulator [Candidatus Hydrogenedentes bacterium]|nr:PadR family transcriptional regulator [Candidatus Hydrogenedentota bacterium]
MKITQCACHGDTLDRFVRPVVMAVLARHADGLHGYLIAQELRKLAMFADTPPDPTGLYRALKLMEQEGYLASWWDVEGSGPARHVYRLTEEGRDCLHHWVDTLQTYAGSVRKTVSFLRESTGLERMSR